MRVMLIAGNFPPDPSIGAVRTGAIFDYLTRRGHFVRVITAAEPCSDSLADPGEVTRTAWIRLPTLHMVRPAKQAQAPELPVAGSGARSRGPLRQRISALAHMVIAIPDPQGGWIPFAWKAGLRELKQSPADIILASGPTFSAHVIAALLARRFGIPWVADYRDLWTISAYYPFGVVRRFVDSIIERWTTKTAERVTTVSSALVEDLARIMGVSAQLVRNGYDPVSQPPFSEREPLSQARLNLLYVGNTFYGGKRTPQPLLQAARELHLEATDVKFHFLGADERLVLPIAEAEGVAGLVRCLPPVDRASSLAMQARADGLMLLLWNNPGERGTVTGKLFEYVGVRRPIVLVGYGRGEAAQIVTEHALGWIVDSDAGARSVLETMLSMKSSPALLPDLPESGCRGLAREEQCEVLERILLETLGVCATPRASPPPSQARGDDIA